MSDFIRILGFQLQLELKSNAKYEYLINNEYYKNCLKSSFDIINKYKPDIVIFPEMSYSDEYQDIFTALSKNRLIIAGSIYRNEINTTIIFQNEKRFEIPKKYASGAEPMVRYIDKLNPETFLSNELKNHTFVVKNKKIIVLNCMEYYNVAYYVARSIKDVFAIVSPCSNNNPKVFKTESNAIHNHNENIYSFVVNCVSDYNGVPYAKGESYVYGPIQYHEKDWLKLEGITCDEHPSSILTLDNNPGYFYGEFTNDLVPYGRSDNYYNNPKNILVKKLERRK